MKITNIFCDQFIFSDLVTKKGCFLTFGDAFGIIRVYRLLYDLAVVVVEYGPPVGGGAKVV